MTRLCAVPLGPEGFDHVADCLRGERGLSGKVCAQGLPAGKVYAIVPDGFSLAQAQDFPNGTGVSMRHAIAWLGEHLKALLADKPSLTILVQDVWAKPTDHQRQPPVAWFVNGESIYFPARTEGMGYEEAHRLMHDPISFQLVGLVSDYVLPQEVVASHQASDAVMDALARDIVEIFLGAYDQEGFVIWQKS